MQIRLSKEDLEKERGAVMEEYRGGRNASGRIEDAHWALMMEGSKVLLTFIHLQIICSLLHSEAPSQGNFFFSFWHSHSMIFT